MNIVEQPQQTRPGGKRGEQRVADCTAIAEAIIERPGIASIEAIAEVTGLGVNRVRRCLRHINSNETPFSRVDYGVATAKTGPYAGQTVAGWWPQRVAAYQRVMDQADDHSARVETGVRWSRLERLGFARGLDTKRSREVVESIVVRLEAQIESLSETDFEAFEDLVAEAMEE